MRLSFLPVLIGAMVAAQTGIANAKSCRYESVAISGSRATSGDLTLDLGEGDNGDASTAWQGPIKLSQAGTALCTVGDQVSLIEKPLFASEKSLLVTTYSGSNRVVFAVDRKTCAILWQSKPFVGEVKLGKDKLTLGRNSVALKDTCAP